MTLLTEEQRRGNSSGSIPTFPQSPDLTQTIRMGVFRLDRAMHSSINFAEVSKIDRRQSASTQTNSFPVGRLDVIMIISINSSAVLFRKEKNVEKNDILYFITNRKIQNQVVQCKRPCCCRVPEEHLSIRQSHLSLSFHFLTCVAVVVSNLNFEVVFELKSASEW
jgi:hypothetical protein